MAEGRLVRAEWGMTAMPLLGGRTVRIRVTVPLAGEFAGNAGQRTAARLTRECRAPIIRTQMSSRDR